MSEQDFVDLAVHIEVLEPTFEDFCTRRGFVRQGGLGRYPRIRIERETEVNLFFDLRMGLTAERRYFQQFFDSIPYDLCAGASIVVEGAISVPRRYQVAFSIWDRIPFCEISPQKLTAAMEDFLPRIEEWSAVRLQAEGFVVNLAR